MKLKLKALSVDPIEYGRFSLHYVDDECLGMHDHFLNNTYSEQEFIEEIGNYICLDELRDTAFEMNISVDNVPIYDAKDNLTNRTGKDYTENLDGTWTTLEEDEYE
jgi:hypothetical protein